MPSCRDRRLLALRVGASSQMRTSGCALAAAQPYAEKTPRPWDSTADIRLPRNQNRIHRDGGQLRACPGVKSSLLRPGRRHEAWYRKLEQFSSRNSFNKKTPRRRAPGFVYFDLLRIDP